MKLTSLILIPAVLLGACTGKPVRLADSPYALVPAGSVLVQHQDLVLPSNTYALQFQNGQQLHHNQIDQYYANCELESRNKADRPRTLKAGRYLIVRSSRYEDYAFLPVKLARIGIGVGIGIGDDFGVSDVFTYVLSMYLQSDQNPNIIRFNCTHWGTHADDDYLTLNVIRQTLHPLFSIKLPGEK